MKKVKKKIRLIKEEEKTQQVTHWDLDYLSKDEIPDLFKREKGHLEKNRIGRATGESIKIASILLIAIGLLLMAGVLYVTSLT